MNVREAVRQLVDDLRLEIPSVRQFLDTSKDYSKYDVGVPRRRRDDKKITAENVHTMFAKDVKKRTK